MTWSSTVHSFGKENMELTTILRQDEDQKEQREMLKNLRLGHPTEVDKDVLVSLHLNSGNLTQQSDEIMEKTAFIFANKKDMIKHNWQKLRETHSSTTLLQESDHKQHQRE
jgi:hypothetical protein